MGEFLFQPHNKLLLQLLNHRLFNNQWSKLIKLQLFNNLLSNQFNNLLSNQLPNKCHFNSQLFNQLPNKFYHNKLTRLQFKNSIINHNHKVFNLPNQTNNNQEF